MKLSALIDVLGGKLVQGSPEWEVDGVSSWPLASPSDVTFAEDTAEALKERGSYAGVLVVRFGGAEHYSRANCVVEAEQPRLWFALAAKLLKPLPAPTGVHPTAVIGQQVEVGENVTIGPCAVIEDHVHVGTGTQIEAGAVIGRAVRLGEHCRIHPRVAIYAGTSVGNWVVVHAGAVLGADGFGYVRDSVTGAYTQFPQQGTLVIEDDVEIGANSTIDRGALAETRIRRGTKIDNLVHVGHNCDIGEDVILVMGTGISGSSTVGKGAVLAGQVGIGDHAHVGPGVILGGQAGVLSGKTITNEGLGVKPGTVLWGTPARPLTQVLREIAVLARLAKGSRKAQDRGSKQGPPADKE
jgi:UDP-3-O-[3-hydroxymyristoyl] glucosamine N-acyltransferase